jgi:hypothetical protein
MLVACLLASAAAMVGSPDGLTVPEAHASVSIPLAFHALARSADRVLIGTVVESISLWEDDAGGSRRIVTYHRVRVDRQATDEAPGDVWVRCMGGIVDGIGQRVEGEAALRTGLRAMLFLTSRSDGTFSVLGLAQGMYPIKRSDDGVERLAAPRSPGIVLQPQPDAAMFVLPGKTVDDAITMVREARRSRAN